ncbi:hypothetical protein GFS31_08280 [Leptolyngbya sp. BL0902]|uniref:hypothetical protein n=1 Tax=Leptolyngbya sp. BL0902 TaxID=1115757 RepID=UPI0018E765FF|nr:hypothetical protein [Leptolyngbya sp. BL0902]QQE64149.1 hypothetical protein GFS31_08280 [Leptolyngbya sp. BL0902]
MENGSQYAPLPVEDVTPGVQSHSPPHRGRTYSTQDIANRYPDIEVKASTVRTRWFEWLRRVAPEPLLKDGRRYTDFAADLFDDFAQRVKRDGMDSKAWVEDAKRRYAHEWSSVGVMDGELMPEEVGNALALVQTQGSSLQATYQQEMADIQAFVDQLNTAEDDFSEAELQRFKAQGALRGVKRFKVETQAEVSAYNALRQQRMQGKGEP